MFRTGSRTPSGRSPSPPVRSTFSGIADNQGSNDSPADSIEIMVSNYSGTGEAGYWDSGISVSRFRQPTSLAFDTSGNLFVAERGNATVPKVKRERRNDAGGEGIRYDVHRRLRCGGRVLPAARHRRRFRRQSLHRRSVQQHHPESRSRSHGPAGDDIRRRRRFVQPRVWTPTTRTSSSPTMEHTRFARSRSPRLR